MSFYDCFGPAAPGEPERLETLVAEVHNTPWNERYCYVLPRERGRLQVSIANEEPGRERFFAASLDLERREIGGAALARSLVSHPFMTGRILAGIYAQAWRLRRKAVSTFPQPDGGVLAAARPEAP